MNFEFLLYKSTMEEIERCCRLDKERYQNVIASLDSLHEALRTYHNAQSAEAENYRDRRQDERMRSDEYTPFEAGLVAAHRRFR